MNRLRVYMGAFCFLTSLSVSAVWAQRPTLEFRAIIGSYEDARPPKGKTAEEKAQAQAAKLAHQRAFVQRVSEEGFNAVVWMGPDEFTPGSQALLALEEFPEARELSVEDSNAAIDYMKQVFAAAKSRRL